MQKIILYDKLSLRWNQNNIRLIYSLFFYDTFRLLLRVMRLKSTA